MALPCLNASFLKSTTQLFAKYAAFELEIISVLLVARSVLKSASRIFPYLVVGFS